MIQIIDVLVTFLTILNTQTNTGYLSAYAQLPTDATIEYRQELGQIPNDLSQFDAYIAVLNCSQVGATGNLYTDVGTLYVIVFDCAGTEDGGYDWMTENNILAELDWYTWHEYPEIIGTEAILILDE